MNFRNISAWSIRNPVVPIMAFIGLLLLGVVSFNQMKISNMPDIEFPAVIVAIGQPGAAPTEIETQITQKVEAAVRTINGVDTISSTASEGSSQTVVMFQVGTEINQAVAEVKNAVDQARGSLPDGILEPQVVKVQAGGGDVAAYGVTADDMTIEQLSWFIDDTVSKRLLSVEGMASVERGGGVNREIRVTLDPARMQSLGITAAQVNTVLRQLNTNAAGGKAEIAGSRQSVRVLGNAKNAYELSQTDIPLGGGRTVKLSDFATVSDSFSEVTAIGKINGKSSITFSMNRSRGASDVSVYDGAVIELAKISKEHPGVHFTRIFTSVDYTKKQYESSLSSIVEGAILAVMVVFFFLRDWRATVISAIAIPLSAIPTFYFLHSWFGFTLNSLSLLALGLVAGVLVDDAIVEIENIVRHMRMGKSAYQASIDAADEIGLAVVATTLSIVAVFLPVGMMGGIPGQFFKSFGLTVVTSVLLSLAVARMITPMVAAYFLQSHGTAEHASGPWMERYLAVLRWTLDTTRAKALRARLARVDSSVFYHLPALALAVIAALGLLIVRLRPVAADLQPPSNASVVLGVIGAFFLVYALGMVITFVVGLIKGRISGFGDAGFAARSRFIGKRITARLRDHRVWMVGVGLGALIITVALFGVLPKQFFPTSNNDFGLITVEMVPGTTLQQTEVVADKVASLVLADPDVATAYERVREGNGRVFINLKRDRSKTSQEFQDALTPKLQQIADARIAFQDMSGGGGGGGGGSGRAISVMLSGSDSAVLAQTATTLLDQMKTVPGLIAPRIAADLRRPEVIITPRADLAASLGVTTAALSQTIRIATLGEIDQNAAKFSLSDRQ
ncbi:MAG: efflux RND transporter permease subunit, partial [Novosphingobium sp.]